MNFCRLVTVVFLTFVFFPQALFADPIKGRIPNSQKAKLDKKKPFALKLRSGEKIRFSRVKSNKKVVLTTLDASGSSKKAISTEHIVTYRARSEKSGAFLVLNHNTRTGKFSGFWDEHGTLLDAAGRSSRGKARFNPLPESDEELSCGAKVSEVLHSHQTEGTTESSSASEPGTASAATSSAELVMVLDSVYIGRFTTLQNAIDEVAAIVAAASVIYERDNGVQLVLSELVAITNPAQNPSSATDSSAILTDFRAWKLGHLFSGSTDLVHLFSGIPFDDNVIGRAWLCTVCNQNYNMGVNERFTSNFTQLTVLLSHEMGHNFCANHDSNTPVSIMYPSISSNDFFSSFSIGEITSFVSGQSCLSDIVTGCGDGEIDPGEECDGANLNGASCSSFGYATGSLGCTSSCSYDTSNCATCGNGIIEADEECDGSDLGGASCSDLGCLSGTPSCSSCTVDFVSCGDCPVCDNDGVCETDEDCYGCPNDCLELDGATCGNGICEAGDGEDCVSCPSDCNGKQNGKPNNRYCCGDGDGQNGVSCSDNRCAAQGNACTNSPGVPSCCGDLSCEGQEDSFTCGIDCGPAPFCGDLNCDKQYGESPCSCALDCGAPPSTEGSCSDGGDDDCDGHVDCEDSDCLSDPICNGPTCDPVGASCSSNTDCCSGKCRGPSGRKSCK